VVEALAIRVLPTYARVGPRFFPYLVAAGFIVLGAILAWRAWRGRDSDADPMGDAPADKLSMAIVVAGLVLQSLIITWIGFVLAATITFVLTAAGFGSRRWLLNAVIGLVLATISYVGFTRGLGLSLPAGILEGLL
jgi:putative tricarboxylic transport membrane protein